MYNPFFNTFVIILALWTIPWKIYAVWTAVKNGHKKWFVALIILNTAGILAVINNFSNAYSDKVLFAFL